MVKRIAGVNSPLLLPLVWQVAKHMLNDQSQRIIKFSRESTLAKDEIDTNILPPAFGGKLKNKWKKHDNATCCTIRQRLTNSDFYKADKIWQTSLSIYTYIINLFAVCGIHAKISHGHVHHIALKLESGSRLRYCFTVDSIVLFGIRRATLLDMEYGKQFMKRNEL
jgi:hypothetical protein